VFIVAVFFVNRGGELLDSPGEASAKNLSSGVVEIDRRLAVARTDLAGYNALWVGFPTATSDTTATIDTIDTSATSDTTATIDTIDTSATSATSATIATTETIDTTETTETID